MTKRWSPWLQSVLQNVSRIFPLARKIPRKKNVLIRDEKRLDEYVFFRKDVKEVQSKRPESNSNPGVTSQKIPNAAAFGIFTFSLLPIHSSLVFREMC